MIKAIKVRHNNVVPMMALGVQQLKKSIALDSIGYQDLHEIHQFLDRFYMSRIGIRMLIGWLNFNSHLSFLWRGISKSKSCQYFVISGGLTRRL